MHRAIIGLFLPQANLRLSSIVEIERWAEMAFLRRFWIYQGERFPLLAHGVLVAAITFAGISLSAATRLGGEPLHFGAWLTAWIVVFGFFFQVRVADEFKDLVDDAMYRPYRPVPRGLIRLHELAMLAVIGMIIQVAVTAWRSPRLLTLLLLVWGYLALMRVEFFAPAWLKAHPLLYLVSHMLIMPLIFLFISACEWLAAGAAPPQTLGGFLALGYTNGIVFEVGRKIRAPQDEEPGVETYSALWGRPSAVAAWFFAVLLSSFCAWWAAAPVVNHLWLAAFLLLLAVGALAPSVRFLQAPTSARAKVMAMYSTLVTLLIFLALGVASLGLVH
jgi:4-hydroxybenzoate polyprenyltransferase